MMHQTQMAQRRHECIQCKAVYLGKKKRYCQDCRIQNNRETLRAAKNVSRSIKRGAISNTFGRTITLQRLIKRDGPRCAICKKLTYYQAHYLSQEYPSIDHIVPLSHGGHHSWTNVRVVHRGCNSFRGNRPSGAIQTALPMVIEVRGVFGTIIMTPVATEQREKR
jgi:5-methylcytosine-specific restriction endonuclease McrA